LNDYLNWEATQIRLKSIATRAVSQSNISATRLRRFTIPVPIPEYQDAIIEKIDLVRQKLSVHQRKQATLTDLFRTLLHQLMTEEIRVHDLDIEGILAEAGREAHNGSVSKSNGRRE
jgi:type I restriction enzyme S subunit